MAHLVNAGDKSAAKYYQMKFPDFSKVTCTVGKNTTLHLCVVPPLKLQTLIPPNRFTEEITYLFHILSILVDTVLI